MDPGHTGIENRSDTTGPTSGTSRMQTSEGPKQDQEDQNGQSDNDRKVLKYDSSTQIKNSEEDDQAEASGTTSGHQDTEASVTEDDKQDSKRHRSDSSTPENQDRRGDIDETDSKDGLEPATMSPVENNKYNVTEDDKQDSKSHRSDSSTPENQDSRGDIDETDSKDGLEPATMSPVENNKDKVLQDSPVIKVGFLVSFLDKEIDISWLTKWLHKFDVLDKPSLKNPICYSDNWNNSAVRYSRIILYYSRQSEKPLEELMHDLTSQGLKQVIVIIGDVENKESEEKIRTEYCKKFPSCELLIFTKAEVEKMQKVEREMDCKKKYMRTLLDDSRGEYKDKSSISDSRHQNCIFT
ncbi:uncharacterized protein O3C94_018589 [Discoglossus pictus]